MKQPAEPTGGKRPAGARSPEHVRHNRRFWDADADAYQEVHGGDLAARPLAWGAYRVPESELQVLGEAAGKNVLELGCGAAQWSSALAANDARAVGLDVSREQLKHARKSSPELPIVLADAERLPFANASFDIVFCDHGAMSFCDPARTLPEVARVIRSGGTFAFCGATPFPYLMWDPVKEKSTRRLHRTYDDLGRQDFGEGTIDWVFGPGEWVRMLRSHGFEIEDLVELRPDVDSTTTYGEFAPPKLARRWPAEWVWKTRRR